MMEFIENSLKSKLLIAAFVVLFLAYKSRKWIPNTNGPMKIYHEVVIFLLCEIIVYGSMVSYLDCYTFYYDYYKISYKKAFLYMFYDGISVYIFFLIPFFNTLYHLIVICNLIHELNSKTDERLIKCTATLRAVFCIIGTIFSYGSIFLLTSSKLSDFITIQVVLCGFNWLNLSCLALGREGIAVEKIFTGYWLKRFWAKLDRLPCFFALPVLISIVIAIAKCEDFSMPKLYNLAYGPCGEIRYVIAFYGFSYGMLSYFRSPDLNHVNYRFTRFSRNEENDTGRWN